MTKYEIIKNVFEINKDDKKAIEMSNYMKNKFVFYGIQSNKRKELVLPLIKEDKARQTIDWDFLNDCYSDEHREFQYVVCDYLLIMQKYLKYEDIPKITYYIENKQWWDTIDILSKIIGNVDNENKQIDNLMLNWSKKDDIWLRRVSIIHQNGLKNKTNTKLLEEILKNNLNSHEFFINKAIGWALREYSKINKEWVKEFIDNNYIKMNNLSIKEASKYVKE